MAAPNKPKMVVPGRALATLQQTGLTELQKKFVVEFIKFNGEPVKAARAAGVSMSGALQYLKAPHVLEAIRKFVLMEFQADAVKARAVLVEVMDDEDSPPMVRRQCAIDILQLASLDLPWMGAGDSLGNLDTSKLSEQEKDALEDLLGKMQRDPVSEDVIEGEVIDNET